MNRRIVLLLVAGVVLVVMLSALGAGVAVGATAGGTEFTSEKGKVIAKAGGTCAKAGCVPE